MANIAKISGTVITAPEYSHTTVGENFYKMTVEVQRTSGVYDEIPCIIPELFVKGIKKGNRVHFDGEVRAYYTKARHLELSVFVKQIYLDNSDMGDYNHVEFDGIIKYSDEPRKTALTNRTVIDFTIVNQDAKGVTNYIPAIAWGRNAYRIKCCELEQKIKITGRFQSRHYEKNETEHTAYEISVSGIYILND